MGGKKMRERKREERETEVDGKVCQRARFAKMEGAEKNMRERVRVVIK